MMRIIYITIVFFLILTSCDKESQMNQGGEIEIKLPFNVFDYEGEDISMQTKGMSGINETKVSNIWILQFDQNGKIMKPPRYIEYNISSSAEGGDFYASILPGDQKLYLVANTFNSTIFKDVTSHDTFKQMKIPVEPAISVKHLLMIGCEDGVVNATTIVSLKRRLAKITFHYDVHHSYYESSSPQIWFKVTSVNLVNAPTHASIFTPLEKGSWVDPGVVENITVFVPDLVLGEYQQYNQNGGSVTFYMPEIIGGIEEGAAENTHLSEKYGDIDNDGEIDMDKTLSYIEITGIYKTIDFPLNQEPIYGINSIDVLETVKYRIYIGEDELNNYNILSNHRYNISSGSISTIDIADKRITITPL